MLHGIGYLCICFFFRLLVLHQTQLLLLLFSIAVSLCPAGRGDTACSLCDVGYFSTGGTLAAPKATCQQCPSGYTTYGTGATNSGACNVVICASGTGGANCVTCPKGTWSAGGSVTSPKSDCQACPANTWTAATGSNDASLCVGKFCYELGMAAWHEHSFCHSCEVYILHEHAHLSALMTLQSICCNIHSDSALVTKQKHGS
jgi:hypothetical protein